MQLQGLGLVSCICAATFYCNRSSQQAARCCYVRRLATLFSAVAAVTGCCQSARGRLARRCCCPHYSRFAALCLLSFGLLGMSVHCYERSGSAGRDQPTPHYSAAQRLTHCRTPAQSVRGCDRDSPHSLPPLVNLLRRADASDDEHAASSHGRRLTGALILPVTQHHTAVTHITHLSTYSMAVSAQSQAEVNGSPLTEPTADQSTG